MNRIKIINTQALKSLRNQRKQLKVYLNSPPKRLHTNQQYLDQMSKYHYSLSSKRRPGTPSEVIKSLYQNYDPKKHRINTSQRQNIKQNMRYEKKNLFSNKNSISYQKLSRMKQIKNADTRPSTVTKKNKIKKMSEQKQIAEQISEANRINEKINCVFRELQFENSLAKIRVGTKMNNYKESKFDRFWNIHKIHRVSAKRINLQSSKIDQTNQNHQN